MTDNPFTSVHIYHCSMQRFIVKISPAIENTVVTESINGVVSPLYLRINPSSIEIVTAAVM